MDEIKLSDYVIEQIKDFEYDNLTEEQEWLINELITDKELNKCYKRYGLCENCKKLNTGSYYCRSCNSQHFGQNFKNWTSENRNVDEFIQKAQLKAKDNRYIIEWIEYDRFEYVEYLAKGGFGTTYKAVWRDGYIDNWDYRYDQWKRVGKTEVALKCLHNSQDITADFLKEIESNILAYNSIFIVRCLGITKDPETNNFMMVMELIKGSLRQHLNNNFISLNWEKKLYSLLSIAFGLLDIHNKGLIHRDFHCGNILSDFEKREYITDLGLCQPANVKFSQNSNKKIYGVLPYVAPEVLREKEYSQANDIYGYGIIAYEICTGFPPYYDIAHDEFLAMKICNGLRPRSNYKIPRLIFNIINQCWDADPLNRPNADKLYNSICDLWEVIMRNQVDSAIYKQVKEADDVNKKLPLISTGTGTITYMTHPRAVYTSRLLDFKNLPKPVNAYNDDLHGIEYSDSLKIDFTKLNINSEDEYN